jgi:hypothetical protein
LKLSTNQNLTDRIGHGILCDDRQLQEAKLNWPLSGNQSWKATVASVPKTACREKWKQPVVRGIENAEAVIRDSVQLYRP